MQDLTIIAISLDITVYLVKPPFRSGPGNNKIFTSRMAMPEAAVDKYDCFVFWQHNIWCSCKMTRVYPISESLGKQIFPNQKLRFGIAAFNPAHIITTGCGIMNISHRCLMLWENTLVLFCKWVITKIQFFDLVCGVCAFFK